MESCKKHTPEDVERKKDWIERLKEENPWLVVPKRKGICFVCKGNIAPEAPLQEEPPEHSSEEGKQLTNDPDANGGLS